MDADCDFDALDDLARGAPVTDRAALERHLTRCEACAHELAWRRAERDLVQRRPDEAPTARLWEDVSARLPPPAPRVSPYRTATLRPPTAPRRPWMLLAAAAAVMLLTVMGGFTLLRRTVARARLGFSVTSPLPAHATVRLSTRAANIAVRAGDDATMRVRVIDAPAAPEVVAVDGSTVEVRFHGRSLADGAVELTVPRGTALDLDTSSGDVGVVGVGGTVRVHTASGDVALSDARAVDVHTASGDVALHAVDGEMRVHTASGDVLADARGEASVVDLETTSGEVRWTGLCRAGCRLDARSTSGDVALGFASGSGFAVRYETASGDLDDALHTGVLAASHGTTAGRFGDAAGAVSVRTTSGGLALSTR